MSSKIVINNVTGQITADGTPISGGGGATSLDDLTDVTIASPSSGQVLKYNGSAWVNDTDAGGAGAGSISICEFTVGTSTVSSSTSIPSGSTLVSVAFQVSTVYTVGTAISIGTDSNTSLLIPSSDISAQDAGIYSYELMDVNWPSSTAVKVTISGSPITGAGRARLIYSASPNN
jgi:hypothetical protein